MISRKDSNKARIQRHNRVRRKISGTAERPRLCVFKSSKHIYAQIIASSLISSRPNFKLSRIDLFLNHVSCNTIP